MKYYLETRSNAEGAVYQPYREDGINVRFYESASSACGAAWVLHLRGVDCVRVVSELGVIEQEVKKNV